MLIWLFQCMWKALWRKQEKKRHKTWKHSTARRTVQKYYYCLSFVPRKERLLDPKERFILMRYTNIQCLLIDCVIPSDAFHQMQVPSDRNRLLLLLLLLLLGGWVSLPTISAECFWLGMHVRDRQVGFSQIKTGSWFLTNFSTLSPFFNWTRRTHRCKIIPVDADQEIMSSWPV